MPVPPSVPGVRLLILINKRDILDVCPTISSRCLRLPNLIALYSATRYVGLRALLIVDVNLLAGNIRFSWRRVKLLTLVSQPQRQPSRSNNISPLWALYLWVMSQGLWVISALLSVRIFFSRSPCGFFALLRNG